MTTFQATLILFVIIIVFNSELVVSFTINANTMSAYQYATLTCSSGEDCAIHCSATDACSSATINCPNDYQCDILCTDTSACESTEINCPNGGACSIQCAADNACRYTTIRASDSSSFALTDCATGISTCVGISVYFPPNINGIPIATITGDNGLSAGITNTPLQFYAINGWNDVNVINFIGTFQYHQGTMYCTNNYVSSCVFASDAWACADSSSICQTAAPTTTIIPTTSIPSTNPTTMNPTTMNPTTINPSFNPTTAIPSHHPTTSKPTTASPTTLVPTLMAGTRIYQFNVYVSSRIASGTNNPMYFRLCNVNNICGLFMSVSAGWPNTGTTYPYNYVTNRDIGDIRFVEIVHTGTDQLCVGYIYIEENKYDYDGSVLNLAYCFEDDGTGCNILTVTTSNEWNNVQSTPCGYVAILDDTYSPSPAPTNITTAYPTISQPSASPTKQPAINPTTMAPTINSTTAEPTTAEPTTAEPTTAKPTTAGPTTADHEPTKSPLIPAETGKPTTTKPTTVTSSAVTSEISNKPSPSPITSEPTPSPTSRYRYLHFICRYNDNRDYITQFLNLVNYAKIMIDVILSSVQSINNVLTKWERSGVIDFVICKIFDTQLSNNDIECPKYSKTNAHNQAQYVAVGIFEIFVDDQLNDYKQWIIEQMKSDDFRNKFNKNMNNKLGDITTNATIRRMLLEYDSFEAVEIYVIDANDTSTTEIKDDLQGSDTNNSDITIIIIIVVCSLIVIIIIVLMVYFKRMKEKHNKIQQNTTTEVEGDYNGNNIEMNEQRNEMEGIQEERITQNNDKQNGDINIVNIIDKTHDMDKEDVVQIINRTHDIDDNVDIIQKINKTAGMENANNNNNNNNNDVDEGDILEALNETHNDIHGVNDNKNSAKHIDDDYDEIEAVNETAIGHND